MSNSIKTKEDVERTEREYAACTETRKHIDTVHANVWQVIGELAERAKDHDRTKLAAPELPYFAEYTPRLAGLTYGSQEYADCLAAIKPALEHHYAKNRHHPEHFADGVDGMTLIDVVEMLADWKAASQRHDDGNIIKSIEHNRHRFGLSDQLYQILLNTVHELGWA